MSGNDILPISTASRSGSQLQPTSGSYVGSTKDIMGKMAESGRNLLARQRPWSEALDIKSFTRPDSMSDATSRLKQNFGYFRANYAVASAAVVFFGLLWHPVFLVILLLLAAAWFYVYGVRTEPVTVFGRTLSERELLPIMGIITFATIFFTSPGTFISILLMAAVLVAAHAIFRTPDDLFLEEPANVTQENLGYHPLTAV